MRMFKEKKIFPITYPFLPSSYSRSVFILKILIFIPILCTVSCYCHFKMHETVCVYISLMPSHLRHHLWCYCISQHKVDSMVGFEWTLSWKYASGLFILIQTSSLSLNVWTHWKASQQLSLSILLSLSLKIFWFGFFFPHFYVSLGRIVMTMNSE